MYGVILAGGSGTRFWPKSRELAPKQFLRIAGPQSMIQSTVARILPSIPMEKILVVTNELHAGQTCRQLAPLGLKAEQVLAEPVGRNTAPAIAFAARVLHEIDPQEIMAVLPADHVVQDVPAFLDKLEAAGKAAEKDYLVTLGIRPARPESGYGYIRKGTALEGLDDTFTVAQFIEKPNPDTAQIFYQSGDYFWNGGIFIWKISAILKAFEKHLPDLFGSLEELVSHLASKKGHPAYRVLDPKGKELFASLPSISIDYGVMEQSDRVAVIPAEMQWSDVGAWNALEEIFEKDAKGNIFSKNVVALDCSDSIVQSEDRLIAAIGAKNLIVIDTPDALLVCDKNRAQDVKKIVEDIRKKGGTETRVHRTMDQPWGTCTLLEKNDAFIIKKIEVDPGKKISLILTGDQKERWTVVSGQGEIQRDGTTLPLGPNESALIQNGMNALLTNTGKKSLTIMGIQTGNDLAKSIPVPYEDRSDAD